MGQCVSSPRGSIEGVLATAETQNPPANPANGTGASAPPPAPQKTNQSHAPTTHSHSPAQHLHTAAAVHPPHSPNQNQARKHDLNTPLGLRTDFGYARDFHEHYTLGKELGHGQFGTTYNSTHKVTGEKLACKTIQKKQMKMPIAVDDVRREVAILQLLSGHPNVVQFKDVFEDDELVYIVMEVCEGGELLDRILSKKDSRYSEQDAAAVVRQMLSVVALCHLKGVVHRDLKPENFLFKSKDDDSALKATDFGLSDFRKPGKRFTDVVGSAYYVAPEVLKRKSGPESDVWSVGVITYILLCGRRPFWDKTEAGIFNEVGFGNGQREGIWESTEMIVRMYWRNGEELREKTDYGGRPFWDKTEAGIFNEVGFGNGQREGIWESTEKLVRMYWRNDHELREETD